jgi:hypothetical protein
MIDVEGLGTVVCEGPICSIEPYGDFDNPDAALKLKDDLE